MTSYEIPLAIIAFIVYYLWRRWVAIEARGKIAPEINRYLADDNNPDDLKDLVYASFTHSLNDLVPLLASVSFINRLFSKKGSTMSTLVKKHGDKKVKKAFKLIYMTIFVNVQLSPISYFFFGLLIVFTTIVRVFMIVVTAPVTPSLALKNVKSKVDSSMINAVA